MNLKQHTDSLLFCAFSMLMFLHISFTFCGFYGNDDINYSQLAAQLLSKETLAHNIPLHYSLRWTCIYVTAAFYQLFGINEISSTLFSFVCLAGTAFLMKKLPLKRPVTVLLYAYILFFFSFTTIFYSHRLLPDTGICFFVFLAYCCYYQPRFIGKYSIWAAVGFSMALFLGAITKESIIITLPLWVFFFASDIYRRQLRKFWISSFITSVVLISAYLLFWQINTGDWLFRYHALIDNHLSRGGLTYQQAGSSALISRLGYELWNALLLNGDFEYLIFGIAAFIYRKTIFTNEGQRHLVVSFLILLLSANFMTYSLDGYNPLLPDPRHYMFLLPFAALSGGYMIYAYLLHPEKYNWLIILFVVADIFLLFSGVGFTKYIYLLITAALVLYRIRHKYINGNRSNIILIGALASTLALNYLNDFARPRYPYYFDQRKLVREVVTENKDAVIYTPDDMTAEIARFMSGYESQATKFLPDGADASSANLYLLVNEDYNSQFNIDTEQVLQKYKVGSDDIVKREKNVILYKVEHFPGTEN